MIRLTKAAKALANAVPGTLTCWATHSMTTIGADSSVANGAEVPVDTVAENEVLKSRKLVEESGRKCKQAQSMTCQMTQLSLQSLKSCQENSGVVVPIYKSIQRYPLDPGANPQCRGTWSPLLNPNWYALRHVMHSPWLHFHHWRLRSLAQNTSIQKHPAPNARIIVMLRFLADFLWRGK